MFVQITAYDALDSLVVLATSMGATTPQGRSWMRHAFGDAPIGALSAEDPVDMLWLACDFVQGQILPGRGPLVPPPA